MKITEIKNLTLNELSEKLISETENLRKIKFAHKVAAIENPMKIKENRRLIAQINTLITQKQKNQ